MKPKCIIDEYGTKRWFLNGELHREDGPAIELANGTKYWLLNGKFHRKDGPAIEDAAGAKKWYLSGEFHREDGPAIERSNGTKEWFLNGKNLTKEYFTSIELVVQLKAFELFTPKELLALRNHPLETSE